MDIHFVMENSIDMNGFVETKRYAFFTGEHGKKTAIEYAERKNKDSGEISKKYLSLMEKWIMENPMPFDIEECKGWINALKEESFSIRSNLNIQEEYLYYYSVK